MSSKEVTVRYSSESGVSEIDADSFNFTVTVPKETYAEWLLAQEKWRRIRVDICKTAHIQGRIK